MEMAVVVAIAGLWMVFMSFVLSTTNFRSKLLLKIIPNVLGFSCLVVALKLIGWI